MCSTTLVITSIASKIDPVVRSQIGYRVRETLPTFYLGVTLSQNQLPASWLDDEQNDTLIGLDLTDKGQLVDKPFRILGVQFRTANSGAHMATVDVETADGNMFSFQDSSGTGVRQEIIDYLIEKKLDADIDTGAYITLPRPLICPRGLRVSKYEAREGAKPNAPLRMTYYLTKTARPRVTPPPAASTAPHRTRKSATPAS